MPPAKAIHTKLQDALTAALDEVIDADFEVDKEFPFQPLPEHECWVADVAVFDRARWDATPRNGYFAGVPQLVIEVLSPSNSASEMLDREQTCLSNGGRQFWLLDPDRRTVKVTTAEGVTRSFSGTGEIPLDAVGASQRLSLARIFAAESQLS